MTTTRRSRTGLVIAAVVGGVILLMLLLVGSCTAIFWNAVGGDPDAGARRDAVRERHGALVASLALAAGDGRDLLDAASRLRGVVLPADAVGLAIAQADSDDNRVTVLRSYDGRQTRRVSINGAGTVTFEDAQGERRTFDLLETDVVLLDGTTADIELVLARDLQAAGPE